MMNFDKNVATQEEVEELYIIYFKNRAKRENRNQIMILN